MTSSLRAAATARGAVTVELEGAQLPRHFGDTLAEYRAVREAVGVVDRSDLAHIRMWGRDPVKMLHGLVTNDLLAATPERAVYAVMLTPKGRVIAELRALVRRGDDATEVHVDLPREALQSATSHLRKFVPPMFARWEDVSERVGVLGVYGPRARELLGRVFSAEVAPLEEDAARELSLQGVPVRMIGTRYAGGEEGYDLFAGEDTLPALWEALLAQGSDLGVRPVGYGALETLRIEAGRPRAGHELTEEVIPTEAFESTGLMPRAISFSKGCYTGQEVIVRIAHRGHVNRQLRGVLLGELPAPPAGTPLFHPETGKQVGQTTSAAYSPLRAQSVALGFVRREVEPGARVRLGEASGPEVEVSALPFTREADGAGA